jgi:hypothetical protein
MNRGSPLPLPLATTLALTRLTLGARNVDRLLARPRMTS